jgi:hypothetical protein
MEARRVRHYDKGSPDEDRRPTYAVELIASPAAVPPVFPIASAPCLLTVSRFVLNRMRRHFPRTPFSDRVWPAGLSKAPIIRVIMPFISGPQQGGVSLDVVSSAPLAQQSGSSPVIMSRQMSVKAGPSVFG